MGGFIIFALFIAVMYFMHKNGMGCCGPGHMHSRDRHEHITATDYSELRKNQRHGIYRPEELVRDPVCDSYVAKDIAVKVKVDGETYYFCSQRCANEFKNKLIDNKGKIEK